jgi:hypothetical protein
MNEIMLQGTGAARVSRLITSPARTAIELF